MRLSPSDLCRRLPLLFRPFHTHGKAYRRRPSAAGLRWWSSWEALWANVTVFDRASAALRAIEVTELTLDHPNLLAAADIFGLRVV